MTTQATNKHPLAEILYAIADGKEVQARLTTSYHEWIDLPANNLSTVVYLNDPGVEYRIKPKEKVKKWQWVFEEDGVMLVTSEHCSGEAEFYEIYPDYANLIQKIDSTEQEFDE